MLGFTREQTLEINEAVIREFRAHGGELPEGHPLHGNPTLLLTTTGARSGRTLISPLTYTPDQGDFIVMASAGGSPRLPSWAHNLRANPSVAAEVGTNRIDAVAIETSGDDHDHAFTLMTSALPRFAEYQASVERRIPLFRIRPL